MSDSYTEDENLVRSFQAGNRDVFNEIDERYRGKLVRFLRKRLNSLEQAEEVAQDALTRAFGMLTDLKNGRLLSQWLYRIAYNDLIDYVRKKSIRVNVVSYDRSSDDDVERQDGPCFSGRELRPTGGEFDTARPDRKVEQVEEKQNVWRVAKQILSDVEFQILWAKYVDDASDEEIGRVVGKKSGAVRVALFRIRKKLAERIRVD